MFRNFLLLAVGAAPREVFPDCREQRCWVQKTATMLHQVWQAPTKHKALAACEHFLVSWREKYPKAVECLETDREELFSFYGFPSSYWVHIRTTNPIESTCSTVSSRQVVSQNPPARREL